MSCVVLSDNWSPVTGFAAHVRIRAMFSSPSCCAWSVSLMSTACVKPARSHMRCLCRVCVCAGCVHDIACAMQLTHMQTGVHRWLRQMGRVEEAPIINYMHSATVDPIQQMQAIQQPQMAQLQMAHSQEQGEGSEEGPEEEAGGYRLVFNTSPGWFCGTNSQVRQRQLHCWHSKSKMHLV